MESSNVLMTYISLYQPNILSKHINTTRFSARNGGHTEPPGNRSFRPTEAKKIIKLHHESHVVSSHMIHSVAEEL